MTVDIPTSLPVLEGIFIILRILRDFDEDKHPVVMSLDAKFPQDLLGENYRWQIFHGFSVFLVDDTGRFRTALYDEKGHVRTTGRD